MPGALFATDQQYARPPGILHEQLRRRRTCREIEEQGRGIGIPRTQLLGERDRVDSLPSQPHLAICQWFVRATG